MIIPYFKNLEEYLAEKKGEVVELAGIVFIYENQILLCYPRNKSSEQQWTIPKGKVDKKEKPKETAVRETFEEVGIKIKKSELEKGGMISFVTSDKEIKLLHYYIYQVKNLKELGLKTSEVPLKWLQKDEIKDARFFSLSDAENLMKFEYLDLLKELKSKKLLESGNIQEAKQVGDLYHFTTAGAAIKILEDGYLLTSNDPETGLHAISFTRDKNLTKGPTYIGRIDVRLKLDGNRMSNKFKIKPYQFDPDWHNTDFEDIDGNEPKEKDDAKWRLQYDEKEERIVFNKEMKLPIKDYLMEVVILSEKDSKYGSKVKGSELKEISSLMKKYPKVKFIRE